MFKDLKINFFASILIIFKVDVIDKLNVVKLNVTSKLTCGG